MENHNNRLSAINDWTFLTCLPDWTLCALSKQVGGYSRFKDVVESYCLSTKCNNCYYSDSFITRAVFLPWWQSIFYPSWLLTYFSNRDIVNHLTNIYRWEWHLKNVNNLCIDVYDHPTGMKNKVNHNMKTSTVSIWYVSDVC